MNYGLQISASGVLTSLYKQDVLTNNLTNMDTVGFKPEIAATMQRLAVRQEDADAATLPSNALLERLGAGVLLAPNRISMAQGNLQSSTSPFDVAIQGEGFLVVRDESAPAQEQLKLTRDGRLARNAQGRLVMATTGMPVLSTSNQPITLEADQPFAVQGDGRVVQNGTDVGQLRLTSIQDPAVLGKAGHGLLTAPPAAWQTARAAGGIIHQYNLEQSGVDEIREMMNIGSAQRDVESNVSMIQQHDRMMDRAINTLGRVA